MKRSVALGLSLALLLSGCAAMLERDYLVTGEHMENPPGQTESFYRVETYSGLLAALRSYVEEGMDTGVLRFPTTYAGNLTVDLEKAKRQLMEEEPLGCYALGDVTFHTSRIIAYYEVSVDFDYRVPPAEYMSIPTVRDAAALDEVVRGALDGFRSGFTVELDLRGEEGGDLLAESLRRVYDQNPDLALGCPELTVTYYPKSGAQAVAEVELTYPENPAALRLRRSSMLTAAEELAEELDDPPPNDDRSGVDLLLAAYELVTERIAYDPEGGSTAADALTDGAANDEGRARLWQLLCHLKGVDRSLSGPAEGYADYQAIVTLPEGAATVLFFKPDAAQGGETP